MNRKKEYYQEFFFRRLAQEDLPPATYKEFRHWFAALCQAEQDQFLSSYSTFLQQQSYPGKMLEKETFKLGMELVLDKHTPPTVQRTFNSKPWVLGMAASLTLILLIGFGYLYWNRPPAMLQISSGNEIRKVALPDGSVITLNQRSELQYPEKFDDNKRIVLLEGEAFFEVAHQSNRPFVVKTGELKTTVLGTKFNVDADSTSVVVALLEGSVKVEDGAQDRLLIPQDQLTYHVEKKMFHTRKIPASLITAWFNQQISFENRPLSEVTDVLEEMFAVEVIYQNDELKQCGVTMTLEKTRISTAMKALSFAIGIKYKIEGRKIYLNGQCNP